MVVEKQQILYGSDVAAPTNCRLFGIFHGGVQTRLLCWRGVVEEVGLTRRAGLFEAEEHDDLREYNGSLPAIEDLFSSIVCLPLRTEI